MPSPHPDILVLPHLASDTIARGLVEAVPEHPQVVALLVPLTESCTTGVVFCDDRGQELHLDLDAVAAHMSTGGHPVGVAHGAPDAPHRRWRTWQGGKVVAELGPEDEIYLPVDEDGFPDLEAPRVRAGDGVPPGHGRFRSCHDLGMKGAFSCRFGPVAHALQLLAEGHPVDLEAYALVIDGRRVHSPTPVPWTPAGHPR